MFNELGVNKVDFDQPNVMAVKYVSKTSIETLTDAALKLAYARQIKNIIFVHHSDILPTSEGAMVRWMVEHIRNKFQIELPISGPIMIKDTRIEVCSLMQFFSNKHIIKEDTLFFSGNYIASIINQYFSAKFDVKNKISQTNFGNEISIFEPKHGPLHSLVDTDQINPTALLSAVVSLFHYLKCDDAALRLMQAIHTTEQETKNCAISFKQYQTELSKHLGR
jgi:isocitrate dehydrogenase